jgi:hypothetical protein
MKSFSKNEIEYLVNNPTDFKQAIIDSKGFILYLADKYTINLPVDLLIETINPYSIRFISEHMKFHKYTPEQTEIVISYLKEDPYYEDSFKVDKYDLNDLLKDIQENKKIPNNANKLLNLSFNDFLSYSNDFIKLINRNSEDNWSYNIFFNSHYLLLPIFKNLTKEEFLKIDKEILYACPSLFNMSSHLMNDSEIKNLFNETVQAYYEHPDRKEGGYKPTLEDYKYYEFEPNEKDLFLKLLKNLYTSDYKIVSKYKGFNKLFTKNEYIFNYDIDGIQYLSPKEIADNLDIIRNGILNTYFQSHNYNFEAIYRLKISKDSFKDIFKSSFIKKIIEHVGDFDFYYFDRDNNNTKNEFINIFHQEVLTLCGKNSNILKLVGYTNAIKNITYLIQYERSYFNQTYANATYEILKRFEESLSPDVLFKNFSKETSSCFSEYDIPQLIFSSMKGKESINYLFALINIHNNAKDLNKKPFVEEINRIITLLNPDDVKNLAKLLDYKINTKLLNDHPRQDYEHNFLNFNADIIRQMNFDTFKHLFELSNDFRNFLIKENLDYIIINEKLKNDTNTYKYDLLSHILSITKNKKSPYYSFLKSFIKKNKQFMLENYFSTLVTHPLRNDFIKIDTTDLEKDSYSKLEKLIGEFATLSLEQNKLTALREEQNKKEKDQIYFLIEEIKNKKKKLTTIFESLVPNLSFEFYSNKIKESDTIKAIQLLNIATNNATEYRNIVLDKIQQLDYSTTKELANNKEFLTYIFDNLEDEHTISDRRNVVFNSFSNEQNIELVELLLKNFNNRDFFINKYNKDVSLSKILNLIPKEQRYEISNDLVIKHNPVELFHSSYYLPNETDYFKKHVKYSYSTEQILQAIDNLNKKGLKILCKENRNFFHNFLLMYNFKYEERDGKNPKLNDYLTLLKALENDPINYLACVHSDIIVNFIDINKYSKIDLAKSAFYNEYININIINEAMKEIFNLHNEMQETKNLHDETNYKGVSIKNAIREISSFLLFTYSSYEGKYESELSEEKSRILIKTLIDQAPYLFLNFSTIGKIDINEELSNNFQLYFHKDIIEDFFISSIKQNIVSDYLNLDYSKKDHWQSKNAHEFIISLTKYLIEEKNDLGIYKLDYIIKENQFNKTRPYDKRLIEFDSLMASFLANEEYEYLIEKALGFNKISHMIEKLNNGSKNKIKPNKI